MGNCEKLNPNSKDPCEDTECQSGKCGKCNEFEDIEEKKIKQSESEFKQTYEDKNIKYELEFKGSTKMGKKLKDIMRIVEDENNE